MIKVFLNEMLIIDMLFECVVVDLVGLLYLIIDKGNRYILIVVDYSFRYLEVVVLKNIDIEIVVEVLVEIFSRVGILREVLLDMGM